MATLTTYQGTISGVSDLFIHTLAVNEPAGMPLMEIAEASRDAFAAAFTSTSAAGQFATTADWTHTTAATILDFTNGDLSAAMRSDFPAPAPGGTGAPLPPQCAICVSLTAVAVRPNGTPIRGRFYLPGPPEADVDDSGLLGSGSRDQVADFVLAWFQNLAVAGPTPAIWSRVLGSSFPVGTIRVGNVVDTIRTRRNATPEVYAIRPFAG